MTTPVVLFIYNRAATTRRVVAALQAARPDKLIVFADGPRSAEDAARCAAARAVVDGIDWQCEVVREYSDTNLGIKRHIAGAITRVLEQFETAIILEDDCVPEATFLDFCAQLLARYRDDERVMTISGTNPLLSWRAESQSYYFARHSIGWGWATWRRAWQHYDPDMRQWADPQARAKLRAAMPDEQTYSRFASLYQRVYEGRIDTFDCQWSFACLLRGGLSVIPAVNLLSNIGFRADATHTTQSLALGANLPSTAMQFPLRHPSAVESDGEYDRLYLRWQGGDADPLIVLQHARHALAIGRPLWALLLIRALCAAQPTQAHDPAVESLSAAARHALEEGRHASK